MEAYGKRIIYMSNVIRREIDNLDSLLSMKDISGPNGWILMYIYKQNGPVYQKDIEHQFGITRSTASKVISLMEKKDLVIRKGSPNDQRLKELVLTSKALELVVHFNDELTAFEEKLIKNISEEDRESFLRILKQMENNIVGGNINGS